MNDTVELLQSCHRGTVTAINSFEQVLDHAQSDKLRARLEDTLTRHRALGKNVGEALRNHGTEADDPNLMARASVWLTTEMRMLMDSENRDHQVAKLTINGCNMGIQTLSEDINRLPHADSKATDLAASLITEEQKLMDDLRLYL
ncbi:MAG: hypothetical protein E7552_05900 [Ruminococcaceae bacterium]|nr:hypothetical protein [Oscillospiraceae bacterium]